MRGLKALLTHAIYKTHKSTTNVMAKCLAIIILCGLICEL